jgi:hypothetical protein
MLIRRLRMVRAWVTAPAAGVGIPDSAAPTTGSRYNGPRSWDPGSKSGTVGRSWTWGYTFFTFGDGDEGGQDPL